MISAVPDSPSQGSVMTFYGFMALTSYGFMSNWATQSVGHDGGDFSIAKPRVCIAELQNLDFISNIKLLDNV